VEVQEGTAEEVALAAQSEAPLGPQPPTTAAADADDFFGGSANAALPPQCSPPRGRDALQRELAETVVERKAFESRLRRLCAEVQLCEASHEALLQKERWLREKAAEFPSEVATPAARTGQVERLDSLEDFLADPGSTSRSAAAASTRTTSGPVFFELEEDDVDDVPLDDPSPSATKGAGAAATQNHHEDAEEALDYLGVARCRQCGIRLPLDVVAIEEHTRHCFVGASGEAGIEEADQSRGGEHQEQNEALFGRQLPCPDKAASSPKVVGGSPSRKGLSQPVASPQRKGGLRAWWPGRSPPKHDRSSRSP